MGHCRACFVVASSGSGIISVAVVVVVVRAPPPRSNLRLDELEQGLCAVVFVSEEGERRMGP